MSIYHSNLKYLKENRSIFEKKCPENREITLDGAISPMYDSVNPKILWILREAHGNGGGSLINDIVTDYLSPHPRWSHWNKTWGIIAKTSYGLLDNKDPFLMWNEDRGFVKDSLRSVAVINLNKFGGKASLNRKRYLGLIEVCFRLVEQQLSKLNPTITICGGTWGDIKHHLKLDLGDFDLRWPHRGGNGTFDSGRVDNGGRLYISAYHPAVRGTITHKEYYGRIIRAVERN